MTTPNDPRRALDGRERPPAWVEITARAAQPPAAEVPEPVGAGGHRRAWLAAAVLLVALALAAAAVTVVRGDHVGTGGQQLSTATPPAADVSTTTDPEPGTPPSTTTTSPLATTSTTESPSSTPSTTGPPSTTTTTTVAPSMPPTTTTTIPPMPAPIAADTLMGRQWTVTQITDAGSAQPYEGATIDARTPGWVDVPGCNGAGGAMRFEGDRLLKDGEWVHTVMACVPPPGSGKPDLMAQDAWFESFLASGPTVTMTTTGGTMRSGDRMVEFVLAS
jgi:hypothetical protein